MDNNILNIVHNNKFLLKLFPDGLNKFALGNIKLDLNDRVDFDLHTKKNPNVKIGKWGEWGKNYDVIVIKLTAQFIQDVKIINWQNKSLKACSFEKQKVKDIYTLKFEDENWSVRLGFMILTFQRCSVYKD